MKTKKHLAVLKILLLFLVVLQLTSCDRGLEIMSVEVIQLPYKMVYIAGVDDSLNMDGCIISIRIRDGRVRETSFNAESRINLEHEIDFSTPGEYEVTFHWGDGQHIPGPIYTMTIQVIAPD